jgi:N-carbamoyl-L-amino-acid hydrolase
MSEALVNATRLNARLAAMAAIGATSGGGVTRLALSDEDRGARDLLAQWMRAAGLDLKVDDVGNMTGHRRGRTAAPPVLIGSHLDTVVKGGRFDGVLGVLAALEVVETLNDLGLETELPIAVVNWTNEEGVRFEPAMTCAGLAAGRFTQAELYAKTDRAGLRFEDELRRIGYLGEERHRPLPASAYLELHIEQGPVLEAAEVPVGIVGGIVGIVWNEVTITGQADHAGPSPMHLRHDALTAAAHIIAGIERIAIDQDATAVATVGRLAIHPNVINTQPGLAVFSADFRHQDPGVLETQVVRLRELVERVCAERGVTGSVDRFWTSEPTPFDPMVVDTVRTAAATLGLATGELWSGAGHDAKYVAERCPSGMIFIRSQCGLSHCETEFSLPDDVEAGANVLLRATLALAG